MLTLNLTGQFENFIKAYWHRERAEYREKLLARGAIAVKALKLLDNDEIMKNFPLQSWLKFVAARFIAYTITERPELLQGVRSEASSYLARREEEKTPILLSALARLVCADAGRLGL